MENKIKYIVVAVSSNTNSFGLYGMIVVSRIGRVYEVAANYLNVLKKGTMFMDDATNPIFENCEIPHRMADMPKKILKQVWAI